MATKRKMQLLVFDNTNHFLIHTWIPTSEKKAFAFLLSLEHMCDGFARFLCVLEFSTQLCPSKQYISTPDCWAALTQGSLHSLSLPLFYFFIVQDGSSWLGKGRGVLQCHTPTAKTILKIATASPPNRNKGMFSGIKVLKLIEDCFYNNSR